MYLKFSSSSSSISIVVVVVVVVVLVIAVVCELFRQLHYILFFTNEVHNVTKIEYATVT